MDSPLASRVHAEVYFESGAWWARDLGSTNGLFVNGERVHQGRLSDGSVIQAGRDAPPLVIEIDSAPSGVAADEPPTRGGRTVELTGRVDAAAGRPPVQDASLSQVIQRYFDSESSQPAGEHTRMIRQAYARVRKRENRKYTRILAGALALLVLSLTFGVVQRVQNRRLQARAGEIFHTMKELDVTIANLRRVIEEEGGAALEEQLENLDDQRKRFSLQYDGYVQELGIYRKLRTEEERLIYRTARLFKESETTISAAFVESVKDEISDYWMGPGRERFRRAIERAESNGYPEYIAGALNRYGVAPDFFYLALQESDFIADRVGPETRWGRAKGMWQFIPETARRYGLSPGMRANSDGSDPLDERQDFRLATDAAARYLRDLHGTLTQASGLLVMASYNWGEHRVVGRLENLSSPADAFEAAFEDVPSDPDFRNYWRFLEEYRDRMPEQTKDYVLKIFSAAVIGQNPKHFGFDFDNPLLPYLE